MQYATFTPVPHASDILDGTVYALDPIPAPPSIGEPPPDGGTPTTVAGAGIPTPVADAKADSDATIASNTEQSVSRVGPVGPSASTGDGSTQETGTAPPAQTRITAGTEPPSIPEPEPKVETPDPPAPPFTETPQVAPGLIGGLAAFQSGITYPRFEREAGNTGQVVVRFVVSPTGVPGSIEVVRSVTPGLDRAAVDAVREARFTPGIQNGCPVPVRMTLPITFRIR